MMISCQLLRLFLLGIFLYSVFFPQLYPGVLTIIFLFNKSTLTLCLFPLVIYLAVLFTLNNVSCIYPVFIYTFSNSFKLKKKKKNLTSYIINLYIGTLIFS
ncbi:Uncharacterized protein CTYZ_00002576 [Cryptosporidium tyzzeri]|nr:Uncharacterized protein CTYZ_00002576 [Cryptosporidium tyzzeri]